MATVRTANAGNVHERPDKKLRTGSEDSAEETEDSSDDDSDDDVSDDDGEDSPTGTTEDAPEQALLTWYEHLNRQEVDIVGDFGGKDLFLIHGDSLILHALAASRVNLDDGFQLLHAIHAVESLLQGFVARDCRVHVGFFDSHEAFSVPSGACSASKYRLTRWVVIRHLQRFSATKPSHQFAVFSFPAVESKEFSDYLADHDLRFVITHDGSKAISKTRKADMKHFLSMIHSFLSLEYRIALIDSLRLESSRIFFEMITTAPRLAQTDIFTPPTSRFDQPDPTMQDLNACSSVRANLVLAAISQVLNGKPGRIDPQLPIAFLVHLAVLENASLSERCIDIQQIDLEEEQVSKAKDFMSRFSRAATGLLQSGVIDTVNAPECDLFDLLDGAVFLSVYAAIRSDFSLSPCLADRFKELFMGLDEASRTQLGKKLPYASDQAPTASAHATADEKSTVSVLPFSHPILDDFFLPVKLDIDGTRRKDPAAHRVFEELTHWHNARKKLDPKKIQYVKMDKWAMKRKYRLMDSILRYSASLTGASGKLIEPEVIIVGSKSDKEKRKQLAQRLKSTQPSGEGSRQVATETKTGDSKPTGKKQAPAKKQSAATKPISGKQKAIQNAQALEAEREKKKTAVAKEFWLSQLKELGAPGTELVKRFNKTRRLLQQTLARDPNSPYAPEMALYLCDTLYRACQQRAGAAYPGTNVFSDPNIAALMYRHILETMSLGGLTEQVLETLEAMGRLIKVPSGKLDKAGLSSRQLTFEPMVSSSERKSIEAATSDSFEEFQLQLCGPFLKRNFDSREDPRVRFDPDAWQRDVLDGIDDDKSLFIVAPTSSGKTFISFYAMKKVLEEDNEGVIVYVAPTKALVNQVAAEVQARFDKRYDHGSLWAIHTRDYRVNEPTNCQVLITVPHVLQIMLLSPANSKGPRAWTNRVRRIIFDEVHCIGQADDGVIWEQLLTMAPCPIIALSATVGNPIDFYQWLKSSQDSKGHELVMVQHHHRYSDLRTFFHVPQRDFTFSGLKKDDLFPSPGLNNSDSQKEISPFLRIHPVAALFSRNLADLDELALEPQDALELWRSMNAVQTEEFPLDEKLNPQKVFEGFLEKSQVIRWSEDLKTALRVWMRESPRSPFPQVRSLLLGEKVQGLLDSDQARETRDEMHKDAFQTLCHLHERDALPAIVFNYDRLQCEELVLSLVEALQAPEQEYKKTSKAWASKLKAYEAEQSKRPAKKSAEKLSKADKEFEAANKEPSKLDGFHPDDPLDAYSFADRTKAPLSEMDKEIQQLVRKTDSIPPAILDALRRGVGVHHAGMNRGYRQIVEIFFRKGFLRVVVATGTLALGLNMPCKTVVFHGDSTFLTTLNYRQGAGRAGRRGFDPLGNVVFTSSMACRRAFALLTSRLPDLKGHFPLSTSLVLRILGLLHETGAGTGGRRGERAAGMITSLLQHNQAYLGGPEVRQSLVHHMRFSIEYLRRQHLISETGAPLNFAGLVGHLYYTEDSAFAFHSLLKAGYFHDLCCGGRSDKDTVDELALVMAHLFRRVPARLPSSATTGRGDKDGRRKRVLPRMPARAEAILADHNREALDTMKAYTTTFVRQHLSSTPDRTMPLTGEKAGSNDGGIRLRGAVVPPTLRSAFTALSGHGDSDFQGAADLCASARAGVHLERSAVPYLPVWPCNPDAPQLNSYLYDFIRDGDYVAMSRDSGGAIKAADSWFMLKDFSLVLATIVTALSSYMKAPDAQDGEDGDGIASARDIDSDGDEEKREGKGGLAGMLQAADESRNAEAEAQPQKKKKKKVVLDSWDDDDDEEDSENGENGEAEAADHAALDSDLGNGTGASFGLVEVLRCFTLLRDDFEAKFREIWA